MTIYRKSGKTARAEFCRGSLALVSISESGIAREEGDHFSCESAEASFQPIEPDLDQVRALASELRGWNPERFTILAGLAEHDMEGRHWSENFARVHIALVFRDLRLSFDLGSDSIGNLDLEPIRAVIAVPRTIGIPPAGISSITLAPHVAASLWSVASSLLPNIRQSTHPVFRFDGDGYEIREASLEKGWPNRYRPSYRSRPRHMPFHLRADWPRTMSPGGVRAMALVEPFTFVGNALSARFLGLSDSDAFVARLQISVDQLISKTRTVGPEEFWFPLAAGAYGSTTLLEGFSLSPD